jgi:hypothetical protein
MGFGVFSKKARNWERSNVAGLKGQNIVVSLHIPSKPQLTLILQEAEYPVN